ncbi:MAG: GNAT family N-acetyltransferase [Treponema sp.]|nr:GNAT family N-acetyltransferase [Treponema sp.]
MIRKINFITDAAERRSIARKILESLTEWFEVAESRESLIEESASLPFFAAYADDVLAGFLCLKETSLDTVDIAVTGVLKEFHHMGLGRELVDAARAFAVRKGYSFLQVKTVREGMYESYDKTNAFYKRVGFKKLEVIEEIWDELNPCQIYIMSLKSALSTIACRRSYRGKFSSDEVPEEDLVAIARAGLDAPSGCNKQTTSLIIVNKKEILDKIKGVIDPPVAQTAPAMIVVLSQRINAYRDRCFAVQDYSAAIENMLLAIVELGYQSCWYEGHITDEDRICDRIAEILNVPDGYDLVCILPVGKALDPVNAPKKKPLGERMKFNGWD